MGLFLEYVNEGRYGAMCTMDGGSDGIVEIWSKCVKARADLEDLSLDVKIQLK
jgi:hypothetical protein